MCRYQEILFDKILIEVFMSITGVKDTTVRKIQEKLKTNISTIELGHSLDLGKAGSSNLIESIAKTASGIVHTLLRSFDIDSERRVMMILEGIGCQIAKQYLEKVRLPQIYKFGKMI